MEFIERTSIWFIQLPEGTAESISCQYFHLIWILLLLKITSDQFPKGISHSMNDNEENKIWNAIHTTLCICYIIVNTSLSDLCRGLRALIFIISHIQRGDDQFAEQLNSNEIQNMPLNHNHIKTYTNIIFNESCLENITRYKTSSRRA